MKITFKQLILKNFKSHQGLTVNFGEVTKVSGDNAQGKSSVLEAITWTLYGNDTTGAKLDPSPVTYDAKGTSVSLSLEIDGKEMKLTRELKSGKSKYYVNDVPVKAKEYDAVVVTLGDKHFFLSLFNPLYFYTLNWTEQRKMLLQYVSAPTNKQVLNEMSRTGKEQKVKEIVLNPQSKALQTALKRHTLDELEKLNKDIKNKMDKAYIAAESRAKTLEEQLSLIQLNDSSSEEVQKEYDEIGDQIFEVEKTIQAAVSTNKTFNEKKAELAKVQHEIDMSKALWNQIKSETIDKNCPTCRSPVSEKELAVFMEKKTKRMEEHKERHTALMNDKAEIIEALSKMKSIDVSNEHEKIRQFEVSRQPLLELLRAHKQHEQLNTQVLQAQQDEKETLNQLNNAIFMLDAIKEFRAKEAEIQGVKVQSLFTTLSVRLFEELKTGDLKPTFVIQMDGKDFNKLSLSESIKAGLELREVLSEQSGVIAPCYVDNAESITEFKGPSGQLIVSRVVAGQELKIEVSDK